RCWGSSCTPFAPPRQLLHSAGPTGGIFERVVQCLEDRDHPAKLLRVVALARVGRARIVVAAFAEAFGVGLGFFKLGRIERVQGGSEATGCPNLRPYPMGDVGEELQAS